MKITWLGHSGFRIEIAGEVLLVDPWLKDNPSFDESRREEAIAGATRILLSHGHFDHANDVIEILTEYQSYLVPVIQAHGGAIDKFLGDGILATFGAAAPTGEPWRRMRRGSSPDRGRVGRAVRGGRSAGRGWRRPRGPG